MRAHRAPAAKAAVEQSAAEKAAEKAEEPAKKKKRDSGLDHIDDLINRMLSGGGKEAESEKVEVIEEETELFPSESPSEILLKLAESTAASEKA